jgi:hypothetical protein
VPILSPLLTVVLLLFVSGFAMGEKKSDEKFGALPAYREYKRTTSPLMPMPPPAVRAHSRLDVRLLPVHGKDGLPKSKDNEHEQQHYQSRDAKKSGEDREL